MTWLNHHMHRNIRPEPYIIHTVLKYLKPIFTAGKKELGGSTLYSFDMSAYVEDSEAYHEEIEMKLKKKYPGYNIMWTEKEIATSNF